MITITRKFNTMREALEGFDKAKAAYEAGYGFYPKHVSAAEQAHPSSTCIGHKNGKFFFTYSRGDSCD